MSMVVELLAEDGSSTILRVEMNQVTTFLGLNPREGEIRDIIARGGNPTIEQLQAIEWWALKGMSGGIPVYTRGFYPDKGEGI